MNNSVIILSAAETVAIDRTVLKNNALLVGAGSCPSCCESMETVAVVGKHVPRTTIHFITGATGMK